MDIFGQIATKIVKEQELIIGPIAWEEAHKVQGLTIDAESQEISFGDATKKEEVIDALIRRYEQLFGQASLEVCRDAAKDLLVDTPPDQVPSLLKS